MYWVTPRPAYEIMTTPRKRIMVTGAVGAGKSTLLHTLFENYRLQKPKALSTPITPLIHPANLLLTHF